MTIKAVIFDWAGTTIDYGSRAPIVAFQKPLPTLVFKSLKLRFAKIWD
ncbi:hypothetical protein T1K45_02480 [Lactiplantibacillus plantarum]|nr:hypothetical protein [Lactiplantibacillus plantarum]WRM17868.1 hypothetical protein T1K45_02480 [Lactiplantibacillus plantarum]